MKCYFCHAICGILNNFTGVDVCVNVSYFYASKWHCDPCQVAYLFYEGYEQPTIEFRTIIGDRSFILTLFQTSALLSQIKEYNDVQGGTYLTIIKQFISRPKNIMPSNINQKVRTILALL